jgi:hypothetical protein
MAPVRVRTGIGRLRRRFRSVFGMNKNTCWLLAAFLALPLVAVAQPGPADPAAAAAPLRYQSAFADYKPWQDLQPGDWRAMNDALAKPGAAHGSQGGDAATPAVPVQVPAAANAISGAKAPAAGHGAHGMHDMPGSRK